MPICPVSSSSCCLAALLTGLAVPISAQTPDVRATARLLSHPSAREWIYLERVIFRETKECAQGESWKFRSNGRLDVTRCVNGSFVKSQHRWSIRAATPIDLEIAIQGGDPAQYPFLGKRRLLLRGEGRQLVLRSMPSSKDQPFVDLSFNRSDK